MVPDFSNVNVVRGRFGHLKHAASKATLSGHLLEFGVHTGASLNFLAATFDDKLWWGFDSFNGLPEPWIRSLDGSRRSDPGEFKLPKPPRVEPNARLVIGEFHRTIPEWLNNNPGRVSFIHIDSDLYSSAALVLEVLNPRIESGTVIAFDELRDWSEQGVYERWREGEWRALEEWTINRGRSVEALARTEWIEGSVRVTN